MSTTTYRIDTYFKLLASGALDSDDLVTLEIFGGPAIVLPQLLAELLEHLRVDEGIGVRCIRVSIVQSGQKADVRLWKLMDFKKRSRSATHEIKINR